MAKDQLVVQQALAEDGKVGRVSLHQVLRVVGMPQPPNIEQKWDPNAGRSLGFGYGCSILTERPADRIRTWGPDRQGVGCDNEAVEQTLAGHPHWVRAVASSSDGRRIVSGSNDNIVRVWDTVRERLKSILNKRPKYRTYQKIQTFRPVSKLPLTSDTL